MPQLIIALLLIALAIWLAVMAIGVALAAIPSWAAGTVIAFVVLLLIWKAKIDKLTSRQKLGDAVLFSVNGSRVHWHLKDNGDPTGKQLDPEIVLACFLGAASAGFVGYFIYDKASSSDKPFFLIAIIVSALAVPWFIAKLRLRRLYNHWLKSRIGRVMGAFDSTLSGMDELREIESSIGNLAGQLRIAFAADYVTEMEQHVHSHQVELVFERAAFSQFMNTRLQSARKDHEELERGLGTVQEMEKLYLQTAREVNRTNSVSLITESDWLGAGLKPENLPTLLSVRKWDEFRQASAMMKDEMTARRERARKHTGTRSESADSGAVPNRMTRVEALRILGLSEGATFAQIERARKEAVKKFNVDHRQTLEPHIRELVEEKFKQVNMAFDFLKSEFQATR
jgi:hypothetical protein